MTLVAPDALKGRLRRPFMLREVERSWDVPRSLPPVAAGGRRARVASGHASRMSHALSAQLAAGAVVLSNAGTFFSFVAAAPRTLSARMMKPMPLSSSAIPTMIPKRAICSAM